MNILNFFKVYIKKSTQILGLKLKNILKGKNTIDDTLLEELEEQLILADVGLEATGQILKDLKISMKSKLEDETVLDVLSKVLEDQLIEENFDISSKNKPFVVIVVGVNGVGKTTSIAKLAKYFKNQNKSVMVAAGDTFRAAAIEQLTIWSDRLNIPIISQHTGADSSSVIFDAITSAKAKNIDVLIADTAGRLQNREHLMHELTKISRVSKKIDITMPNEVLLVLDATTGQNALSQLKHFTDSVGVSGILLSKFDGTAKGGIVFSLSKQFRVPIRFLGIGEKEEDLISFDKKAFVNAFLDR